MLTHTELSKMTEEEIIRYILELTGYNDIIFTVNEILEKNTENTENTKKILKINC